MLLNLNPWLPYFNVVIIYIIRGRKSQIVALNVCFLKISLSVRAQRDDFVDKVPI